MCGKSVTVHKMNDTSSTAGYGLTTSSPAFLDCPFQSLTRHCNDIWQLSDQCALKSSTGTVRHVLLSLRKKAYVCTIL